MLRMKYLLYRRDSILSYNYDRARTNQAIQAAMNSANRNILVDLN